jgi:hypothetical protein
MAVVRKSKASSFLEELLVNVSMATKRKSFETANLANFSLGIWLRHALSDCTRVELEDASVAGDKVEISDDLLPDCRHGGPVTLRVITLQSDEIKVTNKRGSKSLEHVILLVEEGSKNVFIRATGDLPSLIVHIVVIVNGLGVGMMNTTDKKVELVSVEQVFDDGMGLGTNPLGFKANQDVDLRGILFTQTQSFRIVGIEEVDECFGISLLGIKI